MGKIELELKRKGVKGRIEKQKETLAFVERPNYISADCKGLSESFYAGSVRVAALIGLFYFFISLSRKLSIRIHLAIVSSALVLLPQRHTKSYTFLANAMPLFLHAI
jgi:hypothetical protein